MRKLIEIDGEHYFFDGPFKKSADEQNDPIKKSLMQEVAAMSEEQMLAIYEEYRQGDKAKRDELEHLVQTILSRQLLDGFRDGTLPYED